MTRSPDGSMKLSCFSAVRLVRAETNGVVRRALAHRQSFMALGDGRSRWRNRGAHPYRWSCAGRYRPPWAAGFSWTSSLNTLLPNQFGHIHGKSPSFRLFSFVPAIIHCLEIIIVSFARQVNRLQENIPASTRNGAKKRSRSSVFAAGHARTERGARRWIQDLLTCGR